MTPRCFGPYDTDADASDASNDTYDVNLHDNLAHQQESNKSLD